MEYNTSILSLGYILSSDKRKVMMMFHNANANDLSYGKYNGYSDFVRPNESSIECFQRAVNEMTGLTVRKTRFRGAIHWPNFRQQQKSFFAQIFLCEDYEGMPKEFSTLGQNRWVTITEVLRGDLPIWEGDKYFLPLVFDRDPTPFHGYMPYEKGMPRDWFVQRA